MTIRRRRHVDRVNTFILSWCGDEMEQVSFDGTVFNIPSLNEVAEADKPGSPYRFDAARTREGRMLPGTVLVADRLGTNPEGVRVKYFDADMFVKWIEAVRPDLLDRGLFICDHPEEVEEAQREGRPLYEKSQDSRARGVLEAELFRRRKWEEKGTPAPPSSSQADLQWALRHLRNRPAAVDTIPSTEITNVLSGVPQSSPTTSGPEKPPRELKAESIEETIAALTKTDSRSLHTQAKSMGIKLKMVELTGLLEGDEAVMKDVAERIQAKEAELSPA